MDAEVARLKSVPIVATTARVDARIRTLPRREVIRVTFHERQALARQVNKMARRGEIGTTFRTRQIPGGWQAEVIRIKEPGRRWKPWAIALAALAVTAALLWLAVLAVQALAAALAALWPPLAGVALLLAVLAVLGRRGAISIIQSVNIK